MAYQSMTTTLAHVVPPLYLAGLFLSGCAAVSSDEFGASTNGIIVVNGLNPHNIEVIGLRAIDADYTGLSSNALMNNTTWQQWMTETPSAASMFSHLVRCALDADQTLPAVTIDGNAYGPWTGQVGLATSWFDEGNMVQTAEEQELVSACLLAMTNVISSYVDISMRSVALPPPTTPDRSFDRAEAQFFGNVFVPTPVRQTCRPLSDDNAATVLELVNDLRLCALDTVECGFTLMGDCASVCSGWDSVIGAYATCNGRETVATYLLGL